MSLIHLQLNKELVGATYWDQSLAIDLFSDAKNDIILIPGARQGEYIDDISMELAQYDNPTVIITSDEEHLFPVEQLYHPNMNLYMVMPDPVRHKGMNYFPLGYTPKTRQYVNLVPKTLDWFFAGQVTEQRRPCVEVLRRTPGGKLEISPGFAQGLNQEEYMHYMCQAKVIPCPIGNVSPDCFRVYEALEAGAVPVVQDREFWKLLFGEEPPFPVLVNWDQFPGFLMDVLDNYPMMNNKVQAWWQRKKKELKWTISPS